MDKLIRKVKRMKAEIQDEVDLELTASAMSMETTAKQLAPADYGGGGGLRGRFYADTETRLSKTIGNSSEHAAYQEFGTGFHAANYVAKLPKDWRAYAKTFFVDGSGRVPAHPFMYPAFQQERPKLIKRIKKVIGWRRWL